MMATATTKPRRAGLCCFRKGRSELVADAQVEAVDFHTAFFVEIHVTGGHIQVFVQCVVAAKAPACGAIAVGRRSTLPIDLGLCLGVTKACE